MIAEFEPIFFVYIDKTTFFLFFSNSTYVTPTPFSSGPDISCADVQLDVWCLRIVCEWPDDTYTYTYVPYHTTVFMIVQNKQFISQIFLCIINTGAKFYLVGLLCNLVQVQCQ